VETAAAPAPPRTGASLELDRPWQLSRQVALRPEAFGALAYHFGDRRLTFLTSPVLLAVVEALDGVTALRDVLDAAVPAAARSSVERALTTLATADVIQEVRP
jgi:mycofactocin biosynthesis protein MftB